MCIYKNSARSSKALAPKSYTNDAAISKTIYFINFRVLRDIFRIIDFSIIFTLTCI